MSNHVDEATAGFTKPHRRTLLWWAQRETCRSCANFIEEGTTQMLCLLGSNTRGCNGNALAPCSAMRDEGARCGPDAQLFRAIK